MKNLQKKDMCGPGSGLQTFEQLPDLIICGLCIDMSKAAQKQEKHAWAVEEPKLDNALRGIYSIDPEDGEYKGKP